MQSKSYGTGTTFSVAETLCDVAETLHGRKSKNRGTGRKSNQSLLTELLPEGETLRVASFPADLSLKAWVQMLPLRCVGYVSQWKNYPKWFPQTRAD